MIHKAAAWVNDRLDHVVNSSFDQDADEHRQAKRVAAFAVAFLFWTLLFAGLYAAFGAPRSGLIVSLACLPILGGLAVVRYGLPPALAGNLLCAAGWIALTASGALNGGWTAAALLWYTTLPVVSVLTSGAAWGMVWTAIPLASVAVLAALEGLGVEFTHELPPSGQAGFAFCVLMGLIACQFGLAWLRVGVEQRALLALHETNANLVRARKTLATLEAGFGFSMDEWAKLQREKASLERFVRLQFGEVELDERELPLEIGTPVAAENRSSDGP